MISHLWLAQQHGDVGTCVTFDQAIGGNTGMVIVEQSEAATRRVDRFGDDGASVRRQGLPPRQTRTQSFRCREPCAGGVDGLGVALVRASALPPTLPAHLPRRARLPQVPAPRLCQPSPAPANAKRGPRRAATAQAGWL